MRLRRLVATLVLHRLTPVRHLLPSVSLQHRGDAHQRLEIARLRAVKDIGGIKSASRSPKA